MKLIEEILSEGNLKESIKRVKANKGVAGVDKMTVDQIDTYYENIFSNNSYGFRPNRDCHLAIDRVMAADRVMKSVTSWLERKLFLKVSASKTKVVRPTKSKFLGFTFWENGDKWKCKPTNDRKSNLYAKSKQILLRKKAIAKPKGATFKELNQLIIGWINYFKVGLMKKIYIKLQTQDWVGIKGVIWTL